MPFASFHLLISLKFIKSVKQILSKAQAWTLLVVPCTACSRRLTSPGGDFKVQLQTTINSFFKLQYEVSEKDYIYIYIIAIYIYYQLFATKTTSDLFWLLYNIMSLTWESWKVRVFSAPKDYVYYGNYRNQVIWSRFGDLTIAPFFKVSEMLNCRLNNPLEIHLQSDGNLSIWNHLKWQKY